MISERQFQHAMDQVNAAFSQRDAEIARTNKLIQQLKEELEELKPKIGRPKKVAA